VVSCEHDGVGEMTRPEERRPAGKVARLEQLPCPVCKGYLERAQGRHGLVWLCRACRTGAVTLPVLRHVAPRAFVNQLWQAALHNGRTSALVCPACTRPFTEFGARGAAGNTQIKVCVRCFWVWFPPALMSSFSAVATALPARERAPALIDGPTLRTPAAAGVEARRVLGSLAAGELVAALPPPTPRPRRRPRAG
jgi:hypothetical protein